MKSNTLVLNYPNSDWVIELTTSADHTSTTAIAHHPRGIDVKLSIETRELHVFKKLKADFTIPMDVIHELMKHA